MKMQVTEGIVNRLETSRAPMLVGVCGRAGSGKTVLANKISEELSRRSIPTLHYSGDWRFKLDSEQRKAWLREKWFMGMNEYLQATNQFNWWDFEKIYGDLNLLTKGRSVMMKDAYDRKSGKKDSEVTLSATGEGVIFYENCILGGAEILEKLDLIVLLNTTDEVCLERLITKDSTRRNFFDIVARFLMTSYSENLFLKFLLEKFSQKLIVCDSDGKFGEFPEIEEVSQIPTPISETPPAARKTYKGTIFCDLDGTLIKHVPVPSETGEDIEVIEGTPEKLKQLREKGHYLVLTTSRPHHKIFGVLNKLKSLGIEFDQIISDLPVGPRHMINDMKGDEVRTIAHVLKRDEGIKNVKID
jgi:uridine kinase